MRQYEVTFIIDPVLPNEEIDSAAKNYQDQLKEQGCTIVHVDQIGLRPLAYPISKRTSGIYYCVEFTSPTHDIIDKLELSLRRDERIMRFLTIKLDKYGVKYNQDKRDGLIGKVNREAKKSRSDDADEIVRPAAPKETAPVMEDKPAVPRETAPVVEDKPAAPKETASVESKPAAPKETAPVMESKPAAPADAVETQEEE